MFGMGERYDLQMDGGDALIVLPEISTLEEAQHTAGEFLGEIAWACPFMGGPHADLVPVDRLMPDTTWFLGYDLNGAQVAVIIIRQAQPVDYVH